MSNHSFEEAFQRLEQILKMMNEGKVSLDDSLKLFTEADTLINSCNKRLTEAEQKVLTLIKNREGALKTDAENKPETAPFQRDENHILQDEVPF